jgi:hypothetical protein
MNHKRTNLAVCLMFAIMSTPLLSQTIQEYFWITNGSVKAITVSSNINYIGGTFTSVGPNTGYEVGIGTSTGNAISGFPLLPARDPSDGGMTLQSTRY